MEIDRRKLDEAYKKAKQEQQISWRDMPQEQKDEMKRRLLEGDVIEKLKHIAKLLIERKTPPNVLVDAVAEIILGRR